MVLAVACGGSNDKGISIVTQAPARGATPETRTPIGVPPVPPTLGAPTTVPVAGGEAVAFQTPDGALTFRGTLFSAPGPKRKVVVMAAFPTSSEADLQPFAKELAGVGIAALTFQLPVYEGRDFALVDKDIESAVLLLESRDYPQIYVLGDGPASLGVLRLAARRKVAGVVAILAGPVGSLSAEVPKIAAPKLFVAGADPTSRSTLAGYLQAASEPKQGKAFDGPGAGAKLLNGPDGPAVKTLIRDFLLK